MSPQRQVALLSDLDPHAVLQATSLTLRAIEARDTATVLQLMDAADEAAIRRWAEGTAIQVAPQVVHPLAVLSAMTLALANSVDPSETTVTDEQRLDVAERLLTVALRFNHCVFDLHAEDAFEASRANFAVANIWREAENDRWSFWTADLLQALVALDEAAEVLADFEQATGLTVEEWFFRSIGEIATRLLRGAGSFGGTDDVDPEIEERWQRLTVADLSELVADSQGTEVADIDPFNLRWLARTPIVRGPDGARFSMWVGAMIRLLFPAGVAQLLADHAGASYDVAARLVGLAAEARLGQRVADLPPVDGEVRIDEEAMEAPEGQRCCDYLFETSDTLVGVDFTMISPSLRLTQGDAQAISNLEERLVDKLEQIYATMRWRDPEGSKRWLPIVVLVSPSVVEPLMNEAVHRRFLETHPEYDLDESELMTCHATDFLDLLELVEEREGKPITSFILDWRDGELRGSGLDLWLADRQALGSWRRKRGLLVLDRIEAILKRAE